MPIDTAVFLGLGVFLAEITLQGVWIRILKRLKVAQTLKTYGPQRHLDMKVGTPTMGGVVFIVLGSGIALAGLGNCWRLDPSLTAMLILPLAGALIGFLDDWLKFSRTSSEGLSSRQKLYGQIAVVLPWCIWVYGRTGIWLLPETPLGPLTGIPLLVFLAVGFLNAVNITDGLDGLAAGSCLISFAGALVWLGGSTTVLCAFGIGLTGGFLWHNSHPARIFMGDVGAHFLGGILISLAVWSHSLIALFPLAFLFGIETLSVMLQLGSLHFRGKRIFRMSPVHHHFELMGWSETQVVTRFWLVHTAGLALLAYFVESLSH